MSRRTYFGDWSKKGRHVALGTTTGINGVVTALHAGTLTWSPSEWKHRFRLATAPATVALYVDNVVVSQPGQAARAPSRSTVLLRLARPNAS
jgi:hypothetical protein